MSFRTCLPADPLGGAGSLLVVHSLKFEICSEFSGWDLVSHTGENRYPATLLYFIPIKTTGFRVKPEMTDSDITRHSINFGT
jgi:hypothetical protein